MNNDFIEIQRLKRENENALAMIWCLVNKFGDNGQVTISVNNFNRKKEKLVIINNVNPLCLTIVATTDKS